MYRLNELELRNAHLGRNDFKCPVCRKHVRTRVELRVHYRDKHRRDTNGSSQTQEERHDL
jgi:hypothetical protein